MKISRHLSRVIGTTEAAAICDLTPEAIMLAVKEDRLPAKRLGERALALDIRDVERFRDSDRAKGGRPKGS
jgi:hypothetical protein